MNRAVSFLKNQAVLSNKSKRNHMSSDTLLVTKFQDLQKMRDREAGKRNSVQFENKLHR
jgi:hypothetical protein